ncbi:MAG: TonB-dependent receptor, partial [Myxococcales bacterium]
MKIVEFPRRIWQPAFALMIASVALVSPVVGAEPLVSEVSLVGSGAFLNGNDDQFRARHGVPPDLIGGVEDLYMEWLWGDAGTIRLDGHGIVDANDYLARVRFEQPDKGYVSAGYREFRTWYDGTGGFFPQNAAMFSYFDEDLRLDRGESWMEAGLRTPDIPELTFRYTHLSRDGQKNALAWGDTNLTGGFGARSIVPAFWNIDEKRDRLNIDIAHTLASTRVGAGFIYETSTIENSRNIRRNPDEPSDRYVTQSDDVDSDLYSGHAYATRPFLDERVIMSTSYSYSSLDNRLGGSRIYGTEFDATYDPVYSGRQPFDTGFLDLDGSTEIDAHVGTVTLQGRPSDNLRATAGVRVERQDVSGASRFIATDVGFPPALPSTQEPLAVKSDADQLGFVQSFELRYTGLSNWVLYTRGEWEQDDGELNERVLQTATLATTLERGSDIDSTGQKYVAGATWYPLRRVNVGGRYWYQLRKFDFNNHLDSTDNAPPSTNRYPAYMTDQDI